MQIRKITATLGTAFILGTAGLTQAVTMSPAAAEPAGTVQSSGYKDWQKGYNDGYKAGWAAGKDCETKSYNSLRSLTSHEKDYMKGYDLGFAKGFKKATWWYC
ncbi:hypothetical protein AB0M02_18410 [Actinoplanes sp. NPDC051861]|uniref:hypothetical protein n=1 Tax=Actinoplanes sp. NPDC051861 TaxID=3155170 RepID=UPI003447F32C